MTALYKNVAPAATLVRGDTMRMGFAQEHAYLARDASFATDFNGLWSKLFGLGDMAYPVTKNAVTAGMTTAMVDLRITRPVTAADLVNAVDGISGFYVRVASIEKLNAEQAKAAPTNAGAVERETARREDQKQQESESIINKVAKGAGTALNVTRWVTLGIVLVALVLLVVYGKGLLPKASK